MHPYYYNEISEASHTATQIEPSPPPPRDCPQLFMPPEKPPKKDRGGQERVAALVLAALALLLGGISVFLILRWQPPESTPSGPSFYTSTAAPTVQESLERAPNGDGTSLSLQPRVQEKALSLQEIYRKVIPSIVSVRTTLPSGISQGTGVVMSSDGYIITNAHVIEGGFRVDISLEDGRNLQALLLGSDASTDLAVLKVDAHGLTSADFGNSDEMTVGDTLVAIGNPMGEELRGTMTDGILSAINRDIEVNGYEMTLLQTTAALNTGNSGGALVNDQGQVIGITNMKMVSTDIFSNSVEGLGFAIPTATVKPVVDSLIAEGYVAGRPTLGITVRSLYEDEKSSLGVDHGILVDEVTPGSGSDGKLEKNDILLSANGVVLNTSDDLLNLKDSLSAGDNIVFEVDRNGEHLEISVPLMERHAIYGD